MIVLVVDDEENVRKLVTRIIRSAAPEAEIHTASDGIEAGRMAVAVQPGLVVLDIQLPGVDGLRICRNLREDGRWRDTKVLAMSGRDVEEARRDLLEAGADGFLGKPFGVEEFRAMLVKIGWLRTAPDGGAL